jgi:hypothetical protein
MGSGGLATRDFATISPEHSAACRAAIDSMTIH